MSKQRIFLNKYDLLKILEIIEEFPGYDEKNFEIEYDNSSGIGYSIFMIIKWNVNGVDGDFRIPIADETDW